MFFEHRTLIASLSQQVRIGLALFIGFCVVTINHYTVNQTRSDSAFSELVHSLADCVALCLLWYTTQKRENEYKHALTLAGATLLIVAGVLSIIKAYTTFTLISIGDFIAIKHTVLFVLSSGTVALLVLAQLLLIQQEHNKLHRHQSSNVLYAELWSDMWHALSVVTVAVLSHLLSTAPIFVRFVDFTTTLILSVWMITRGYRALFPNKNQQCIQPKFTFPKE